MVMKVNIFKKSPLLNKVLSDQTADLGWLHSKYDTIISSLLELVPGGKLFFGCFCSLSPK